MALTIENNEIGATAMGNAFQQAGLGQAQQTSERPSVAAGANPFGFGAGVQLSPGRMAYSPIRNAMGSEAYSKLGKELRELVKDQNRQEALDIAVLELDRNVDPNLHFASFLVCVQAKAQPELGVGYNIVMMAATGEEIPARSETVNGESVSIPMFAEVANDARLIEVATNMLLSRYGNKVPLFRSDTQVIPADFNAEDKTAVENLAANAAAAATSSLVMFAQSGQFFHDLNLVGELKNRAGEQGDADLTFVYNFNPQRMLDYLKLPTRASIVIHGATGYRKQNRNASVNSGSGPKTITESAGFIELMPILPRYVMPQYNPMQPIQAPITQRLAPVLVLSSLKTNFAYTPGAMILNVLQAADLNRGHGWVSAFANKMSSNVGGISLDDVTAITIDMPSMADPSQPEPRPTVPAGGMPIDMLMKFLGTYCQPNLYVAMDIPVAAHNTWSLSLFAEAAKGSEAAVQAVINSFDTLLNGKFRSSLPANTRMFASTPMLLERGYWDADGERRDVADIDYVAVCNYADANNNPTLVEKWTNSFLQTSRPTALRLQDRREIIQEITGQRATFIGRSVRVFWNGNFLAHALKVLAEAGVTTSHDGRGEYGFGGNRAHADFLNGAALPTDAGWATGMGSGGGGYNYGYMNSTPWGGNGI